MSTVYLRAELTDKQELEDWELVKKDLGVKTNTQAILALIRTKAKEVREKADTSSLNDLHEMKAST